MLIKFTNKCNKFVHITFVHINIKFIQKFNMLMLISLSLHINVTTYVVHINIKFMQKLKHAHAHKCLQNTSVQTLSYLILILNKKEYNSRQNFLTQSYEEREYNSC